jgi:DNA-binding HxlR family transcriptional regulator
MEMSWDNAMTDCADETCPVARAVGVLDGKWTILVIRDLLAGTRRFSELRASLAGISPKMLAREFVPRARQPGTATVLLLRQPLLSWRR